MFQMYRNNFKSIIRLNGLISYELRSLLNNHYSCKPRIVINSERNVNLQSMFNPTSQQCRYLSVTSSSSSMDENEYEEIADETLDNLSEKLEYFLDKLEDKTYDIMLNVNISFLNKFNMFNLPFVFPEWCNHFGIGK